MGQAFVGYRMISGEPLWPEKLRAILQNVEKLEDRGWSRSRARDYYDLWRVLGAYRDEMDLSDFASFLQKKCAVRSVTFKGPDDFFQDRLIAYVKKTWEQWLGPLVYDLPSSETVMGELRPQIESLMSCDLSP